MVKILGIPTTLGCNVKGCDLAPQYLRSDDLFSAFHSSNISFSDLGDIQIDNTPDENISSFNAKNFNKIKKVSEDVFEKILSNADSSDQVLSIGGDHSMAIGSVFASSERFNDLALIWIDAHADSNSPKTSLTGNVHGMPLSTVMGDSLFDKFNHNSVDKSKVVLLGIKDVDNAEWDYIHENKITAYTIDDIIEKGIGRIWMEIENIIGKSPLHVSMDIDGLDWEIAPGTGIINNGGINYREIKYLTKKISMQNLIALDITEINPLNDINFKTRNLATELIMDYLGGRWTEYERYLNKSQKEKTVNM